MHIPIATKGHENLFVALAKRKRIDGSTLCSSAGSNTCAPKIEYLVCTAVEFYLYPTVGTVLIHSVKPELTE